MENYVRWFGDISKDDVPLVGGKGANLGELTNLNLLVPNGFCITVSAYWDFISNLKNEIFEIMDSANFNDQIDMQKKTGIIRDRFLKNEIPQVLLNDIKKAYSQLTKEQGEPVAVRSSATAEDLPKSSFAGQHETFLNVVGLDQFLIKVKECWASLWTPQAVFYRLKKGFDHKKVGMCVVVQKMVSPSVSGVMFTYNSIKGSSQEIIIESTWGLGEGLVSGIVNPDSYLLNKSPLKIKNRNISEKKSMIVSEISGIVKQEVPMEKQNLSTLSDEKILMLAKIGLKIEDHYKSPQDIEWCLWDNRIYILQARPVTDIKMPIPKLTEKDLEGLKGEWTKSPLDERVSEPLTPFTWSIAKESIPSFFETLSVFGFYFPKDTDLVRLFYGRPYVSKTELEKIFINLPGVVDDFLLGGQTQITRENIKPSFSMLTMGFRALLLVNQVHKDWDREYPKIIAEYETLKKFKTEDASSQELLEKLDFILGLAKSIGATHALSIIFCEALYQMLFIFVSRYVDGNPNILCPKLVTGLKENKTLETNKELWILTQKARASKLITEQIIKGDYNNLKKELSTSAQGKDFLIQFHEFLNSYGHRSPKYDLYFPSWRDDPNLVLDLISTYLAADASVNPEISERKGIKEREEATDFVLKDLRRKKLDRIFPVKKLVFLKLLSLAQKYMMLRENQQFYIGQGYPIGRGFIFEIGSRFFESKYIDDPGDIFFLTIKEVRKLVRRGHIGNLKNRINKRKAEFELYKSIDPPAIITKEGPKDWEYKESLKGLGGSPGVATGFVRIITDLDQFSEFRKGEILVAPTTNPSWTPLFMVAKGVVTELGGMLCHGAVVAREYKIPAVLGVKNATRILKNGQKITIDGAKGIISTHD